MAKYIQINGAREAAESLEALPEPLAREVIRKMAAIAYSVAEEGARSHTTLRGTGALLQSLYNRGDSGGGPGRAVGHDPIRAPHALFVVFGTRPHKIRPKTKKSLRWVGAGGRFVFAGEVDHPGYRGDDYMGRAADRAVRDFSAIVTKALEESIR